MNLFAHADKPEEPTLEFSWDETTFSYSVQKIWTGDSITVNHSGSYTDTYDTYTEEYNSTDITKTIGEHTIFHEANYSYVSEYTIIGNITIDFDFTVYRVNIDYGSNVKVIWIAFKQGTMEMEYYQASSIHNFSYYEEYHQNIESEYEQYDFLTDELLDSWSSTDDIYDEKQYSYIRNITRKPYFLYQSISGEYSLPLILTIQLFTTENKDRIAWLNMFYDLLVYKDLDSNMIYSVADKEDLSGPPYMTTSKEWLGWLRPKAFNYEMTSIEYYNEDIHNVTRHWLYPIDKSVSEIASTIQFTSPTDTTDANVTWGITYPGYPTDVGLMYSLGLFRTEWNSSYIHSCPFDYSFEYDYKVGENQTDLDITWELGKITNASLYNASQGYGLVMPQYNYFLSTFDIDEIDTKALSLPCSSFDFESNDTLVATINMGGPDKKNYTLYDFPISDKNTVLESEGGSIHPMVMWYSELSSYYEEPFINSIFTLVDIVKQDPSFNIVDNLFRIETQNYPVWSGEKLRHDPTLTVYFEEYEVEEDGGKKPFIPGYNYTLFIGTVGIITFIIVFERRKKKIK